MKGTQEVFPKLLPGMHGFCLNPFCRLCTSWISALSDHQNMLIYNLHMSNRLFCDDLLCAINVHLFTLQQTIQACYPSEACGGATVRFLCKRGPRWCSDSPQFTKHTGHFCVSSIASHAQSVHHSSVAGKFVSNVATSGQEQYLMSSEVGRHTAQSPAEKGEGDGHPTLVTPNPQNPTCHTGCADLPHVGLHDHRTFNHTIMGSDNTPYQTKMSLLEALGSCPQHNHRLDCVSSNTFPTQKMSV